MRTVKRVPPSSSVKVMLCWKWMSGAPSRQPVSSRRMSCMRTTSVKVISLGYFVPSGLCMMRRHLPPGRRSISRMSVVKPFGPHHCPTCHGSARAPHTIARGAANTREMTISFAAAASKTSLVVSSMLFLLVHQLGTLCFSRVLFLCFGLQALQVFVQSIKALFPELAVLVEPAGGLAEGLGL